MTKSRREEPDHVDYCDGTEKQSRKVSSACSDGGHLYHENGKVVAKLSNPHQDRVDIAKSLFGILPADVTLEEAKEERLNRI